MRTDPTASLRPLGGSSVGTPGNTPLWALFDAEWYLEHYRKDIGAAGGESFADAEAIYDRMSVSHRHSPNPYFDEKWYLSTNPDVARSVAGGEFRTGFAHYIAAGHQDRSPHWLFSETFYLMNHLDLTRSRLDQGGFINGYDHYLRAGDRELRQGSLFFDPQMYILATGAVDTSVLGPFARFVRNHCLNNPEPRLSWYFDPAWYLETYASAEAEVQAGLYSSALHHYLCNPTPRSFDPCRFFSEEFYLSVHLDVADALADGRFRNSYDHFTQYGAFERRKPHPDVDLESYFASVSVQADIESGLARDAFAHFVARASSGQQQDARAPVSETDAKRIVALRAGNLVMRHAKRPLDFAQDGDPAVSVIVVMHNKIEQTLLALAALHGAAPPGKIDLLLVDSGSTDDTRQIERFVHGARYIRFNRNVGFVEGCNAAIRHVRAPATLFLNNDAMVEGDSVQAALERLHSAPEIGAVGGKIIRTNGLLQEAGCTIWSDGSTTGYLRDRDPNLPEANFVRDVDFCSGVCLLVRTSVFRELVGFDEDYKPAYFEEADLCIRIHQSGLRIVYDPAVVVSHYEYATSDASIASLIMGRNQPTFRTKNQQFLLGQLPRDTPCPLAARHARSDRRRRVLFIEDRLPFRMLGSGFTRSNDVIRSMVRLGYHVTLFPIYRATESILRIYGDFPDEVEVIYDRELPDLPAFLNERAGYFDILWVARTHNADRVLEMLENGPHPLGIGHLILDAEAVAAFRTHVKSKVLGLPAEGDDVTKAVERELLNAKSFHACVAVNHIDAELIRAGGYDNVKVLGHLQIPRATPLPFEERQGLLFVGAIHDATSPNLDSLQWFVENVLPRLMDRVSDSIQLTIAGYVNRRVDLTALGRARGVDLRGPQPDLSALYGAHRVFVAPTRFAGGIPYKLHEAAAYGLPIFASQLLIDQLGWTSGVDLLGADSVDPGAFAAEIARLYNDPRLWASLRDHALARVKQENNAATYDARLSEILQNV
jgi:O-antigen biosynthesis protein